MTQYPQGVPHLERHILDTYFYLRLGMGVLALAFPLMLALGGKFVVAVPFQESMSAYYHTGMRNIFVGVLSMVAVSLFLYKGFTKKEDKVLNFAAFMAIGIALFPTRTEWTLCPMIDCQQEDMAALCNYLEQRFKPYTNRVPHGICAGAFFLALAYVSWFRSQDTLYLLPQACQKTLSMIYKALAVLMVALPAASGIFILLLHMSEPGSGNYAVFFIEFAAIWVFALYWLLKTWEIYLTSADIHYQPVEMRSVNSQNDN